MQTTSRKLSDILLYSNRNLETLCRTLVSESSNGFLVGMYGDKALLGDQNSGELYSADYSFDGKVLTLENFDHIELSKDESSLSEAARNYFDADGYDTAALVEAYEEDSESGVNELEKAITEGLLAKPRDLADYTQLSGVISESPDLEKMDFWKSYRKLLSESPSASIKCFNWVDPVKVSMIDADAQRTILGDAKSKAQKLSKDKEFRKMFAEAADEMLKGSPDRMEEVLSENSAILALDSASMKEFIGMAAIGNRALMDARKDVLDGVGKIVEENESLLETKTIYESDDEPEEGAKESKDLECSSKDIDALKAALDKALEKVTDEKIVSKINSLKDALDACEDTGTTDVGTVKECVEILSL